MPMAIAHSRAQMAVTKLRTRQHQRSRSGFCLAAGAVGAAARGVRRLASSLARSGSACMAAGAPTSGRYTKRDSPLVASGFLTYVPL
jgi:hypothetical protein